MCFSVCIYVFARVSEKYLQQATQNNENTSRAQLVKHLLFSSKLTQREISTFLSEFFAAGVDTVRVVI